MKPLVVTETQDRTIREHGERVFPHECCGFLFGRQTDDQLIVALTSPAVNIRGEEELHNRFTISPEAFLAAEKMARREKLDILGFYHSHPNAPARPSQYDLDHAWPVYAYLIVEVRDGQAAEMTSWVLAEDRSKFESQSIEVVSE